MNTDSHHIDLKSGFYNGKNFRYLIIMSKKISIAIDAMGENSRNNY